MYAKVVNRMYRRTESNLSPPRKAYPPRIPMELDARSDSKGALYLISLSSDNCTEALFPTPFLARWRFRKIAALLLNRRGDWPVLSR